jgi:hypothetical protein
MHGGYKSAPSPTLQLILEKPLIVSVKSWIVTFLDVTYITYVHLSTIVDNKLLLITENVLLYPQKAKKDITVSCNYYITLSNYDKFNEPLKLYFFWTQPRNNGIKKYCSYTDEAKNILLIVIFSNKKHLLWLPKKRKPCIFSRNCCLTKFVIIIVSRLCPKEI